MKTVESSHFDQPWLSASELKTPGCLSHKQEAQWNWACSPYPQSLTQPGNNHLVADNRTPKIALTENPATDCDSSSTESTRKVLYDSQKDECPQLKC